MNPIVLSTIACCLTICGLSSCSQKPAPAQSSYRAGPGIDDHRSNTLADRLLIKEIILRDLGIDQEPGPADYQFGFYIVEVDSDEVLHFKSFYKSHAPRVEVCALGADCSKALVDEEMRDLQTRRPCHALSARIAILTNNSAVVSGSVSSGKLGGAFWDYSVTNENKKWRIVGKKLSGAI